MMNSKKKSGLIAFIAFNILIIGYCNFRNYILDKHSRYTIGLTTSTFYTSRGTKMVEYIYNVNNKKYISSDNYYDCKVPNGRYYVKFSVKYPNLISEIYQDKPVPNSIKQAPPNGWSKIPGE